MNCNACQEQLRLTLDGTDLGDQAALEQHLGACAACRAYRETTRRLQAGLKLLRPSTPPPGFTARLVAAVQEDRRRLRRRARLRLVIGLAVAACVILAVSLRLWPSRPAPTQPNPPETVKKNLEPTPPEPVVATVTPRQSVESAVEAVTALTTRTTTETMQQTRKLIPLMGPTLAEFPMDTTMPTLSLRDAGHGVSEGLEPVTTHAKRAVGLLRRDLLPDF